MSKFHINTQCLQEGYSPKNGEPRVLPIVQSTTYKYDSSVEVGKLFDLEEDGFFYSRIGNPTVDAVEKKIAALEGGVGALLTSAGMSAIMVAVLNICNAGDHIVSSAAIYGGTMNLFTVTLKRFGIDVTLVQPDVSEEELRKAVRPNTKVIYAETIANPSLCIVDLSMFAKVAHDNDIPFMVDNTFATPVNCKPIEFGADIVVHSTSKYMDGHAVALGGVIVDGGTFNWANGKFPGLSTPDDSYHGVIYTDHFKEAAYIAKARLQLMRDMGVTPSANSAFLLNLGLETLPLRMERHCYNAQKVAEFLEASEHVTWVNFPGLKSCKFHEMAEKYMPNGTCGVISFGLVGEREAATKFMDSLKLASIVVHVADARTSVLHPASTTHRQLTDEQLEECGVGADLIRMSIGIEYIDDIINDIKQAFDVIYK
ncbi:MAG: aminotransferase class V-fold PLP-dependent enzyme [bacterium]|nr:aminotransferase class V-fold PLP-dependent enzyme [bacterium]